MMAAWPGRCSSGEPRSTPRAGGALPRAHRRGVELPDRAARRARHRDHACGRWPRSSATPEQTLRSVTTVFAAQVRGGRRRDRRVGAAARPLDLAARGHGAQSRRRRRAQPGRGVRRGARPASSSPTPRPPVVPPPHECPSFRDPPPPGVRREFDDDHMNFWDHVEGRPASGHPPWEPYVPTTSERAAWYRFDEPPMLDDGRLDPLAILTMCDTMPGAVSERMGRRDQLLAPAELRPHRAHARRRAHRVDPRGQPLPPRGSRATRRPRWRSGTAPASTSSRTRRSRCCSCSPTVLRRPRSGCRSPSCEPRCSGLLEELPEHRADLALTSRLGPRNSGRARYAALGIRDAELPLPTPTTLVHARPPFPSPLRS